MNLKTIVLLNNRKKTDTLENDILLRCYNYFCINSFLIDFKSIVKNIKSYFLTS